MWRYVKIPKAIALLAFLLPWMTVSCSNNKIAEANGWELVIGRIRPVMPSLSDKPQTCRHLNYYLAAAVALIVVGLILSLMRRAAGGRGRRDLARRAGADLGRAPANTAPRAWPRRRRRAAAA